MIPIFSVRWNNITDFGGVSRKISQACNVLLAREKNRLKLFKT